ncbi:MAG: gamma-glutamylcyclotransferase [Proteobacteria bacterium]|nr:gamma-glutamylcyclotransferase [Pseudomonadota bacterium]
MTDRTVRLFSYGTLQLEAVQRANFGRRLDGAADVMPGYRQTTIRITDPETIRLSGTDTHFIVAPSDDPDDTVAGMVFEITPEELAAADAYEVSDYRRVEVRLGSGLDAWVYVKA